MVEMVHESAGTLVCCGQPMNLLVENAVDASKEKHVPVTESAETGILVKVGAVPHPMEEKHYIEWVEILTADGHCRKFLKPGQKPEASFKAGKSDVAAVREYCNIHGLWKG
jgi:superoxide reductase